MVSADETVLTERQVEVLGLREQGLTQQEVADELGTTDANVSAIERAATTNVEKARRTLDLVRTLRTPVQFTVPSGASFDDLTEEIYSRGDEAGIKIAYSRPELYTHLYGRLESHISGDQLETAVEIGLAEDGDVEVFSERPRS